MNFTNLGYFIALTKEMNFTQAAKKLHISQQALSNHILRLEEEFGVSLFDRGTPLTLTTAGKCLLAHAQELNNTKERLEKELTDIRDFRSGELSVGITVSRGSILLPLIMPEFKKQFPQIKVTLIQKSTSKDLEKLLLAGEVDLIIGFTPSDTENIEMDFLCNENILLVIPDSLLKQVYPQTYQSILDALFVNPNIVLVKDLPFIAMDKNTQVGMVFNTIFKEKGLTPKVSLEVYTVETMISLCLKELGAAICPQIFIDNPLTPCDFRKIHKVHTFQINNPEIKDKIYISWLKSKYLTLAAKEFISITQQVIQSATHINSKY